MLDIKQVEDYLTTNFTILTLLMLTMLRRNSKTHQTSNSDGRIYKIHG